MLTHCRQRIGKPVTSPCPPIWMRSRACRSAIGNRTAHTKFGKINSTRDGQNGQREIQFALKFYF